MPAGAGGITITPGMTFGDLVHQIYGPQAGEYEYATLRTQNPFLRGISGNSTKLDQFAGQQAVFGQMSSLGDIRQAGTWDPAGGAMPAGNGFLYNRPSDKWNPFQSSVANGKGDSTSSTSQDGLTDPGQRDAFAMLQQMLSSWGLSDLASVAQGFLTQGLTANEVTLKLQQTDQYKQRFAGNEERIKNGLTPLQPADYIALENQYQQILSAYGLPKGFYDNHTDFVDFIGKNISPAELDTRAKIAQNQYLNAPQQMKNLWSQYFGGPGDAIAAILDPETATAVIQNRATQVGIGGAAAQHGFNIDQQRAQQFQQAGVSEQQAQQAYQQISEAFKPDQLIANRFGTTFGQQAEEDSTLLGDAESINKRKTLYAEERGLFKSTSGANIDSLGVNQAH